MPSIKTLNLRVKSVDAQRRFYSEILGMRTTGDGSIGYTGEQAKIRFEKAVSGYSPQADDLYWKIALAVPNIELACEQLTKMGVETSTPNQFHDVGYLAHFRDPEGFGIELIDHRFKGDRTTETIDENLLGGGAHLNLITLRTADIAADENVVKSWGMTPLSIQPVESHGFTLYFYAFTDDKPPCNDLRAVDNRTWVYQRPYTVLELQHVHNLNAVRCTADGSAGYAGFGIANANPSFCTGHRPSVAYGVSVLG